MYCIKFKSCLSSQLYGSDKLLNNFSNFATVAYKRVAYKKISCIRKD